MKENSQLKILLGPIKQNSEIGKAATTLGIKCFSDSDAEIIYNIEKDTFQDITARLPAGWEPDIVLFWSPEYNTIPLNIEKAECTTIAIVGDWNLGFSALKENLKRFDWIMTDKAGVEVFKNTGYQNINYWPMFSFNPVLHKILPDNEKIYDIVFAGNFNHMIHSERARWLYRVSNLAKRYKVKLVSGIYGEEYTKTLNQAKIVFNHSVRQEMNMRAYEVPACGSLLFIEDSNLEISDFLSDKKECILYNSENFEHLIDYYLENDSAREKITVAGNKRIQLETHQAHLQKLIGIIEEKNLKEIKNVRREFSSLSHVSQLYQASLSAIQGITSGSMQLAGKIITKGLDKKPENPDLWNALIVLYANTALLLEQGQKNLLLNKALSLTEKVLGYSPDSVLLYFTRGNISLLLDNKENAKVAFLKALELIKSKKNIFKECHDLFFPRSYDSFRVEWERVTAYFSGQPELLFTRYKNLLNWRIHESLGDISFELADYFAAKEYYNQAIQFEPDLISKAGTNLALSLNKLGKKQEAADTLYRAIKVNPLEPDNYHYLVDLLYELKQFEDCRKICEKVLIIISAIPSYENIRPYFESFLNQVNIALENEIIIEGENEDFSVETKIESVKSVPELEYPAEITKRFATGRKLNIFILCWHTPYLSLLAKTGHNFEVANWTRLGDGSVGWNFTHRPLPDNMKLIDNMDDARKKITDNYYNLVICQTEYDIGFIEKYDVPAIYLAHNALFTDTGGDKMKTIMLKKRVKNFLNRRKNLFAAISKMKMASWKLPGMVITPGIDINDYGGYQGDNPEILTVSTLFKERDFLRGYSVHQEIVGDLPYKVLGNNPTMANSRESKNWDELKSFYRESRVYLNTTIPGYEDGYNLAMLEAMATGMPVVSLASPTSPLIDGENGFVSGDINYLRNKVKLLLDDPDLAKEIGQKGRQTIADNFSIKDFIDNWNKAFDHCLNSKQDKYSYKAEINLNDHTVNKPRVLIASAFHPNFINRFYEKAFRKMASVITCGPAFVYNDYQTWAIALDYYGFADNIKFTETAARNFLPADIPLDGGEVNIEEFIKLLPPGWNPDLFVWIDSNSGFLPTAIEKLNCPTVCLVYDNDNFSWKLEKAGLYDKVLVQKKNQLKDFAAGKAVWLPPAADLHTFNQFPFEKIYDISFIGQTTPLFYTERKQFLERLAARGFDLNFENNILEEMALIYNRSKIIINYSFNGELNNRVFEAMATGSLLFTDRLPVESGLTDLFVDRQHLVIYNEENLEELLNHYLNNSAEREVIAAQGRKEILKNHTYLKRVNEILLMSLNLSENGVTD
jgi:spore maturation protein CgeB